MTSSSFPSVPQSSQCPWMAASILLPYRMVKLIWPGSCRSFFFLRQDIQDSDACPLWLYQGKVMPWQTDIRQPPSANLHTVGHWCFRWPRPILLSLSVQAPIHAAFLPVLLPWIPLHMLHLSHHHMPWCPSTSQIFAWSLYTTDFFINSRMAFREVRSTWLSAILRWNKAVSPEVAFDTKAPYSPIPHLSRDSL